MDAINIIGTDSLYIPLSDAFSVDIINQEITFGNDILYVTNINCCISSEYVDIFNIIDEKFVTVILNISIKFDYISKENSINYQIIEVNKLINICIGDNKINKNSAIHSQILDANIICIEGSTMQFCIVTACSIDI